MPVFRILVARTFILTARNLPKRSSRRRRRSNITATGARRDERRDIFLTFLYRTSAILHFVLPVTVREFFYLRPARCAATSCISSLYCSFESLPLAITRKDSNLISSDAKHPRALLRLFASRVYTIIRLQFQEEIAQESTPTYYPGELNF